MWGKSSLSKPESDSFQISIFLPITYREHICALGRFIFRNEKDGISERGKKNFGSKRLHSDRLDVRREQWKCHLGVKTSGWNKASEELVQTWVGKS